MIGSAQVSMIHVNLSNLDDMLIFLLPFALTHEVNGAAHAPDD